MGDRVGYTTRSVQGGSYADFTVVSAPLVVKLPEGVSTQDAAAVLLQGLTALSQATTAIANDIKQGEAGCCVVLADAALCYSPTRWQVTGITAMWVAYMDTGPNPSPQTPMWTQGS